MLINKWLVTGSVYDNAIAAMQSGVCFYFEELSDDPGDLYSFIQKELFHVPVSVLLSGTDFKDTDPNEHQVERLLGLFFQPFYYMADYHPVLFLKNPTSACSRFLDRLQYRCSLQGLKSVLVVELRTEDTVGAISTSFGLWVNTAMVNYDGLIGNWLAQYLNKNHDAEIHILVPYHGEESREIMNEILLNENAFKKTTNYKVANTLYEKDRLIEACRNELALKELAEKNNKLYLSIQKEGRASALEWYNREYEVLPLWYKRFGHVIKVLTGKRTFRSLFDDNVKKYID